MSPRQLTALKDLTPAANWGGCLLRLPQEGGLFDSSVLPRLPRNAQYEFHENRCYDWGTVGWAISQGKVDTTKYRAFVFMNSSVRGPFLPGYIPV